MVIIVDRKPPVKIRADLFTIPFTQITYIPETDTTLFDTPVAKIRTGTDYFTEAMLEGSLVAEGVDVEEEWEFSFDHVCFKPAAAGKACDVFVDVFAGYEKLESLRIGVCNVFAAPEGALQKSVARKERD